MVLRPKVIVALLGTNELSFKIQEFTHNFGAVLLRNLEAFCNFCVHTRKVRAIAPQFLLYLK
jgi:hypothetical protein